MTRNENILLRVLDGEKFTALAQEFGVSQVTIRTVFLNKVRKIAPELYKEGIKVGLHGTYATPSVDWLRQNKKRILAESEKKRKAQIDFEIAEAIAFLETWGYAVTPNANLECVVVESDWPGDIAHFCNFLEFAPGDRMGPDTMTFEVRRDLPDTATTSAMPNNALEDARALARAGQI